MGKGTNFLCFYSLISSFVVVLLTAEQFGPFPGQANCSTDGHRRRPDEVLPGAYPNLILISLDLFEGETWAFATVDNPMLLPFTPLMRGGATEQMVRRCAGRIRQEPQAAELEVILTIFAGYVLDIEIIRSCVKRDRRGLQSGFARLNWRICSAFYGPNCLARPLRSGRCHF